jgi:hypothetical protein
MPEYRHVQRIAGRTGSYRDRASSVVEWSALLDPLISQKRAMKGFRIRGDKEVRNPTLNDY